MALADGQARAPAWREAASCYRAALEDLRQAQDPALWIRLQRRLGTAALTLDEQSRLRGHRSDRGGDRRAAGGTGRNRQARAIRRLGPPASRSRPRAVRARPPDRRDGRARGRLQQLSGARPASGRASARRELWADLHHGMGHRAQRHGRALQRIDRAGRGGLEFRHGPGAAPAASGALPVWARSTAEQGLAMVKLALRRRDMTRRQQALIADHGGAPGGAAGGSRRAGRPNCRRPSRAPARWSRRRARRRPAPRRSEV